MIDSSTGEMVMSLYFFQARFDAIGDTPAFDAKTGVELLFFTTQLPDQGRGDPDRYTFLCTWAGTRASQGRQ